MKNIYTEINIKENMPSVCDALEDLKGYIKIKKSYGYRCLIVVHGYGSTGKGGKIREEARRWLKAQEKNQKLKTVIFGEEFDIYNEKSRVLNAKYKELKEYYCAFNHGVTIVEL